MFFHSVKLKVIADKGLSIGVFTAPLLDESSEAMREILKDSPERAVLTVPQLTRLVARMSTRVFMSKELSNDEQWLTTTADYINTLFLAGFKLSFFPRSLRPVAQWLLPSLMRSGES